MDFYQTSKCSLTSAVQSSYQKGSLNDKIGYWVCGANFPPPPCSQSTGKFPHPQNSARSVPRGPQNTHKQGATSHRRSAAAPASLLKEVTQVGKVHILCDMHIKNFSVGKWYYSKTIKGVISALLAKSKL